MSEVAESRTSVFAFILIRSPGSRVSVRCASSSLGWFERGELVLTARRVVSTLGLWLRCASLCLRFTVMCEPLHVFTVDERIMSEGWGDCCRAVAPRNCALLKE